MSKMSAKQGESTQLFNISIKDLTDYTDYECEISVFDADEDPNVLVLGPLTITIVDNKFPVALTPAQTTALPPGSYTVIAAVIKDVAAVIEFRREVSWALKITPSLFDI
jgi:hypothetical protein